MATVADPSSSAEELQHALLVALHEDFPGWAFTWGPRKAHPWEARQQIGFHSLGGAWAIKAKDAEILRELVTAAVSAAAKISGVQP
ncbi:hypothetical protein [Actinomadura violacea]|uniref:Uncharacterized protein n=1 Tax=Actinomadura violacea TaxID=2819934 RepID=A0ABS3RIY4_9ACTN|nr:hypothetical protein [Actinomadura violacea]MBO2456546.1 hypothetical protein [Actinomadura violacea]